MPMASESSIWSAPYTTNPLSLWGSPRIQHPGAALLGPESLWQEKPRLSGEIDEAGTRSRTVGLLGSGTPSNVASCAWMSNANA